MPAICTAVPCRAASGVVVGQRQRPTLRAPRCSQQRASCTRQHVAAGAAAPASSGSQAAASSSGPAAASVAASSSGSAAAPVSLLQRVLASCSLADRSTLLLAAALGGCVLLGAAEPALAAQMGSADVASLPPPHHPQTLGDLAENADFWGNVLRYVSYFFSVLLGTAYIAIKPILELLKRPTTAVLVVAGLAGLFYFVSFTVQAMLGLNDAIDYTASSIVTPVL